VDKDIKKRFTPGKVSCKIALKNIPEVHVSKKMNARYSVGLAISAVTFLLYLPALQNGFVDWDDRVYIFQNPHIRSFNLAFLKWAFLDFYASNWHPLTWLSHAVDYAFWGLNPLGHHLTCIVLHAVNSFLVVLLSINLLETVRRSAAKKTRLLEFLSDRTILITAGATGLLFGVHPVHVESVAWVSERKDLLCAFFFMLSIMSYTTYVRDLAGKAIKQSPAPAFLNKHYLITMLFFILALLSKPMAVTLPLVLLILDWYPFQRFQSIKTLRPVFLEKIPFFAFSLLSSLVTVLAQKSGASVVASDVIPLSTRIFVATKALLAYLGKMIWPANLLPFYQYYRKGEYFEMLVYLAPILAVIGITVACVLIAKKQKVWATAWGYYVVTMIPVLGVVQVGSQLMADRYTYLPSLAPFLIAGLFAAAISEKTHAAKKQRMMAKMLAATAAIVVLISLSYLTIKQIAVWNNTVSLWSRVIEKEPSTVAAYKERAEAYKKKGELDKAIPDYDTAIALYPGDYAAYFDRGSLYHGMGMYDKARADYDKAISMNPVYSAPYNNRGVLFINMGLFEKAVEDFSRSITMNPHHAEVYNNRGFAYFSLGRYKNALEDFTMAISLDPDNAQAYFNRGNLSLKTGRKGDALADFRKACDRGDADGCRAVQR
jgi:protein O-mannosyl-transferase